MSNMSNDRTTNLQMAYQEVCKSFHALDDFRAKLLALLPLASGTLITLLAREQYTATFAQECLVPAGILGVLITFGLLFFEVHGNQRCSQLMELGTEIEDKLGIKGQFTDFSCMYGKPTDVGLLKSTLAVGLVYSAVVAGWIYVVSAGLWRENAVPISLAFLVLTFLSSMLLLQPTKNKQKNEQQAKCSASEAYNPAAPADQKAPLPGR